MEARNKTIEQWFSMIAQGQIVLPRFQRHEAWSRDQIAALMENALRKPPLPMGTLLVLEIGNQEPFLSRPIVGAPTPTGKPAMHLLDGQQRMTALWRSLTDDYADLTLFVSINQSASDEFNDSDPAPDSPKVEAVKRWERKSVRQPVWAEHPAQQLERGVFPAAILCPGSRGEAAMEAWLSKAEAEGAVTRPVERRIYELRTRVASYMIPFLALGPETGRETALDVFIRMNTSASPLKDFDIVVAQLEEAVGQSLHELVEDLLADDPRAKDFGKIDDIALSVGSLLLNRVPLKKTYLEKSFGAELAGVWPDVQRGIAKGLAFLRDEGIINEKCQPSDVAVYMTCALWALVPDDGFDAEGRASTLIRKALWRACYTDRYGKTATTRAFADFRALRKSVEGSHAPAEPDLFDDVAYPLPDVPLLQNAGWPVRKDRLPRAVLATTLRAGGWDFADGQRVSAENIGRREFHHLFPVSTLGLTRGDPAANRAMNCALISWKTNRKVAAKSPQQYIEARAEAAHLGEAEVKQRLATHLVPYDVLRQGDYESFLRARAELVADHMRALCQGAQPR